MKVNSPISIFDGRKFSTIVVVILICSGLFIYRFSINLTSFISGIFTLEVLITSYFIFNMLFITYSIRLQKDLQRELNNITISAPDPSVEEQRNSAEARSDEKDSVQTSARDKNEPDPNNAADDTDGEWGNVFSPDGKSNK